MKAEKIQEEPLLDEKGKRKTITWPQGPNGELPNKALGVFIFQTDESSSQSQIMMHGIANYEIPGLIKQLKRTAKLREKQSERQEIPGGLSALFDALKNGK